jgi:putative membrane protein insertion efficiency factor
VDVSSFPASPSTRIASSVAALAILSALALDAQPIALAGIHGYQRAIAPLASRAGIQCRFTPSCSRYAEAVIARDGVVRGGWKSLKRIARCNPLTPPGTREDP